MKTQLSFPKKFQGLEMRGPEFRGNFTRFPARIKGRLIVK